MSTPFEIGAQLAIVIDLAVENYRDTPVFVEYRLFTGDEIDDRQPSHSERYTACYKRAFRIGTTMDHPLTHRTEQLPRAVRRWRVRIDVGPTGDTAHFVYL